jgi:histo-blood group ABO system transferase
MVIRAIVLLLFLSLNFLHSEESFSNRYKVGLCIVATGRYDQYAQRLIDSARPFFCTNSDVTYFIFTDGKITPSKDVVICYQKRLGWPHDTLKRFEMYERRKEILNEMDYLFALDADMYFVARVGEEILSDLVATQFPGYVGRRGPYEKNPSSTACVRKEEGEIYFAGAFYGGKREEFFKLLKTVNEKIAQDEAKNVIAKCHDESHLNRYFIDHKPTLVLSPSYCYPESWQLTYPKKLLALDKNHKEMRK